MKKRLNKSMAIAMGGDNHPRPVFRQKVLTLSPSFIKNLCTYFSTETHHLQCECVEGVPKTAKITNVEYVLNLEDIEFGSLKITIEDGSLPEVDFAEETPELKVRFERNWETDEVAEVGDSRKMSEAT